MNVFSQMSGIAQSWENAAQAQQAALNGYSQFNAQAINCYQPPREMTPADLGLHPDSLRRMEHERAFDATLARLSAERRRHASETAESYEARLRYLAALEKHRAAEKAERRPYSFWLGANA